MNDASALKSDEEIVQYILSHASAFEFNSVRAIKKRDELLEDARRLAQEEISDCEQYKYFCFLAYISMLAVKQFGPRGTMAKRK